MNFNSNIQLKHWIWQIKLYPFNTIAFDSLHDNVFQKQFFDFFRKITIHWSAARLTCYILYEAADTRVYSVLLLSLFLCTAFLFDFSLMVRLEVQWVGHRVNLCRCVFVCVLRYTPEPWYQQHVRAFMWCTPTKYCWVTHRGSINIWIQYCPFHVKRSSVFARESANKIVHRIVPFFVLCCMHLDEIGSNGSFMRWY